MRTPGGVVWMTPMSDTRPLSSFASEVCRATGRSGPVLHGYCQSAKLSLILGIHVATSREWLPSQCGVIPMHSRRILSSLIAIAAVLVVACGSDDVPLATAVPATAPAIAAPFVPATPVPPVAFVAPTTESLSDLSSAEAVLLGLGEYREFPSALYSDSERLPLDEANALWIGYLSDSRVINAQNTNMLDFCSDGTGYFFSVTTQGLAQLAGESFEWEVLPAIGGRWNEQKLRITPMDTSIVLANFSGLPYNESILTAPTEEDPTSLTRKFTASTASLPGILHPNEGDLAFTFSDSADTVCRG